MNRKLRLTLLVCWLTACAAPAVPRPTVTPYVGTPRPVIVDTDMAADDWLAILYLLQRQDISVIAITVTGTGGAHCEPGVQHALGLIALAGQSGIPVACGRETPLQGDHAFPKAWREDVDNLLGLTLPQGSNPAAGTAVELLAAVIQSSPEKIILLTLGPLTNVAEALQATPTLKDQLATIVIMGGAVKVPGNVGASGVGIDNPVAEWNIYADPYAASLVFQSGAPITLVPLDATNQAPITMDFFDRLERDQTTPEAEFVYRVLTRQIDFIQSGGYYFWDPLAAAILADESLATIETMSLKVVEEEGLESGWTQPTKDGTPVRVAVWADGQRFERIFLDTLNAQP